jgi:hypothetical protein
MISDFARVLREKLRTDMNNYADDLAGGMCRSFDDYQKLCGVIQGLAIAERHILDLVEKVEQSDE